MTCSLRELQARLNERYDNLYQDGIQQARNTAGWYGRANYS